MDGKKGESKGLSPFLFSRVALVRRQVGRDILRDEQRRAVGFRRRALGGAQRRPQREIPPTTDHCRLWTIDYRLSTVDCRLSTSDSRLATVPPSAGSCGSIPNARTASACHHACTSIHTSMRRARQATAQTAWVCTICRCGAHVAFPWCFARVQSRCPLSAACYGPPERYKL